MRIRKKALCARLHAALANRSLARRKKPRCVIFQKAKAAEKRAPEPRIIQTKVVGVTFNGRQAVVKQLVIGETLLLRREPDNPYDSNAISVERIDGEQVGYIDRNLAAQLAPGMDGKPIKASVMHLVGGYARWANCGVMIRFAAL